MICLTINFDKFRVAFWLFLSFFLWEKNGTWNISKQCPRSPPKKSTLNIFQKYFQNRYISKKIGFLDHYFINAFGKYSKTFIGGNWKNREHLIGKIQKNHFWQKRVKLLKSGCVFNCYPNIDKAKCKNNCTEFKHSEY